MPFILNEDAALKTYLSGITVADEKTPSRAVGVWFGYPDVEIRQQSFPFITIDLIGIRQARERQTSGLVIDADNAGTIATTWYIAPGTDNTYPDGVPSKWYSYDVPIAYDLMYQVTSHSRHPRHDRSLLYQMHQKFPALYGHLEINNELGTSTARRHMFLDSVVKNDKAEGENGNKRLLRNTFTVRVVSEMTPAVADAVSGQIVTAVSVNHNTSGSWTQSHVPTTMFPV